MPAKGSVLLLAPTPKGWGETAFAVHLGRELNAAGWKVQALIHAATAPLFAGAPIGVTALPEAAAPLLELMLEETIKTVRPQAVVLCDIVTSIRALKRTGAGPDALFRHGIPVTGIDTWNSSAAGPSMDLFGADVLEADAWLDKLPRRLRPVPFLPLDVGPGACRFLPKSAPLAAAVRRHIRREFGLGANEKLVLFCTSAWQYGPYRNRDGERVAAAVPRLVSDYLASLGPSVHLVHVGPARYDGLALGSDRYHWMPPQRPEIFDMLMGSADLFLSLNVSGVSTIRAVASGVPTAVFGNSFAVGTKEELAGRLRGPLHPLVEKNASGLLPIYPFTLWPLGLSSFLAPTLQRNAFLRTFRSVELMDGVGAVETLNDLLFSPAAAESLRAEQKSYESELAKLPRPAEAFSAALGALTGEAVLA